MTTFDSRGNINKILAFARSIQNPQNKENPPLKNLVQGLAWLKLPQRYQYDSDTLLLKQTTINSFVDKASGMVYFEEDGSWHVSHPTFSLRRLEQASSLEEAVQLGKRYERTNAVCDWKRSQRNQKKLWAVREFDTSGVLPTI